MFYVNPCNVLRDFMLFVAASNPGQVGFDEHCSLSGIH